MFSHRRNRKILGILLFIFLLFLAQDGFSQSKKLVAVLAFKNLTGDTSLDYICSGFGETLTTKLFKVKELELIERMQLIKVLEEQKLQLSGLVDEKSAVKAGKLFGVQYVVIGSIQKAGSALKADTRLISVVTGKIEAANDVAGNYENMFSLQEELALKLIKSFGISPAEKERVEIVKKPTESLSAYEWYAKGVSFFEKSQYNDAIRCFKTAIDLDKSYADAITYLGESYGRKSLFDEGMSAYRKVLGIYGDKGDDSGRAKIYSKVGELYILKGYYDTALEYLEKSLKIAEKLGDESIIADALGNIGAAYTYKRNFRKALAYFEDGLKLSERLGKERDIATYHVNIGAVYRNEGNNEKARTLYNKSLRTFERLGDMFSMAVIYHNIGAVYVVENDFDNAMASFKKSLEIKEEIGDEVGKMQTYMRIAELYDRKGDKLEMLEYLERAIEIACRLGHGKCRELRGIKEGKMEFVR